MVKGFTIAESVLVIGITAVIFSVSAPSFVYWQRNVRIKSLAEETALLLRTARTRSISGFNSSEHGIHIGENRIILFEGGNFPERETAKDLVIDFSPPVRLTNGLGANEVYFAKRNGYPSANGIIGIEDDNGRKAYVHLDKYGLVFTGQ